MRNRFNRRNFFRNRFNSSGYRLTLPRQAIIDFMHSRKGHFSVEEIFEELKKKFDFIGIATIYRNLSFLNDQGLVHKFDFGDGRARYELIRDENKEIFHPHLICSSCGKIIDCEDVFEEEKENFKKIESKLAERYNFNIKSHIIQFKGLCLECSNNIKGREDVF